MKILTHNDINTISMAIAEQIYYDFKKDNISIYPIPRGGIAASYIVFGYLRELTNNCEITDDPNNATVFLDDLIDSGKTKKRYLKKYPNKKFYALYTKGINIIEDWIVFPWENTPDASTEDIPVRLLQMIGQDVNINSKFIKNFLGMWREVAKFQ